MAQTIEQRRHLQAAQRNGLASRRLTIPRTVQKANRQITDKATGKITDKKRTIYNEPADAEQFNGPVVWLFIVAAILGVIAWFSRNP